MNFWVSFNDNVNSRKQQEMLTYITLIIWTSVPTKRKKTQFTTFLLKNIYEKLKFRSQNTDFLVRILSSVTIPDPKFMGERVITMIQP